MRLLKTHDKLNKFGIPLGYTRVEYIESTGEQYIDTGVSAKTGLTVEARLKYIPNTGIFCGAITTAEGSGDRFYPINFAQSGKVSFTYLDSAFSASTSLTSGNVYTIKTILGATKQEMFVDDVSSGSTSKTNVVEINCTVGLFALHRGESYDVKWVSQVPASLYYCKIWDDDTLVREFVPCLDLLGKPCLYDLVGQKTYYNLGSGADFTIGRKIIPVEYLETNSGQYIDTGIQPTDEYGYRIRNTYTAGGGEQCAIGCMDAGNRFVGVYTSGSSNAVSGAWGSYVGFLPNYPWTTGTILDVKCNYKNDRKIVIDDTEMKDISDTHVTGTISNSIYIGARNYGANVTRMIGKIYGTEITKGSEVIANYIPCKDENNVGFMFDTIGSKVCLNIGTGSFIVGEEAYDYKDTVRFIKDGITGNLPRGYTRIEYIEAENNGNILIQYTVGNYRLTDTTDWEITCSASSPSNNWIIGQPNWVGVHYRKDTTTGNLTRIGITNSSAAVNQCYVDYTDNEKITLVLKGTDVYANGTKVGSITRASAGATQTKYGIFGYKDIAQDLPNLRIPSARIYEIKIWDNGTLVQHLLPVLDPNGEPCFYDTVNKTTIKKESNCTSDFTTGNIVSSGLRLLEGDMSNYTFLDYIESTGTQYIDTGIAGSSTLKIEMDGQKVGTGYGVYFGAGTGNSRIQAIYVSDYNSARIGDIAVSELGPDTEKFNIIVDALNKKVIYNGTSNSFAYSSAITNLNIYLFTRNEGNKLADKGTAKCWHCRIWDNDKLIRNFVPVLRKSDSKPGLYDMVEGKFYVNQATGADFNYGYKQ